MYPLAGFPGHANSESGMKPTQQGQSCSKPLERGGWPRGERKEMKGERPREGGCLRGCHFHKPVTNKANYLSDPYKPGGSGKCP